MLFNPARDRASFMPFRRILPSSIRQPNQSDASPDPEAPNMATARATTGDLQKGAPTPPEGRERTLLLHPGNHAALEVLLVVGADALERLEHRPRAHHNAELSRAVKEKFEQFVIQSCCDLDQVLDKSILGVTNNPFPLCEVRAIHKVIVRFFSAFFSSGSRTKERGAGKLFFQISREKCLHPYHLTNKLRVGASSDQS